MEYLLLGACIGSMIGFVIGRLVFFLYDEFADDIFIWLENRWENLSHALSHILRRHR